MTHLGRGSVNAAMRELQSRGFIRCGYAKVELIDVDGLGRFADENGEDAPA